MAKIEGVRYFGDTFQDGKMIRADVALNRWLHDNGPILESIKITFVCNCDSGGNTYHCYNVVYSGRLLKDPGEPEGRKKSLPSTKTVAKVKPAKQKQAATVKKVKLF